MIFYWILFLIPAFKALTKPKESWGPKTSVLIWISLVFSVGLRHEVGCDWFRYLNLLDRYDGMKMQEILFGNELSFVEPFYDFINWLAANNNLQIYGVNTICAMLFSTGLIIFCKSTPRPWLALTIAVPYLVFVVAMGYTRQAVSISCLMVGYLFLSNGKVRNFLILCGIAATFHKASVVALPFALPYLSSKNRLNTFVRYLIILLGIYGMADIFILDRLDFLIYGYIENKMNSGGAAIRAIMNILPSTIFLMYGNRLMLKDKSIITWRWLSILSILCGIAILTGAPSTFIDRLGLYALPIQIFVFSRLPDFKVFKGVSPLLLNSAVVFLSLLTLLVWLFWGNVSFCWIPYRNLLAL